MKHSYKYIFLILVLLLAACGSEEDMVPTTPQQENSESSTTEDQDVEGVTVSMPEFIDGNNGNEGNKDVSATATSRSTLIYDSSAKKALFSWGDDDDEAYTCVFALNKDVTAVSYDEVTPIVFTRKEGQDKTALQCSFVGPEGVTALAQKDNAGNIINYIAFRPYPEKNKDINYLTKSISYEGQTNSKNVEIKKYFTNTDNYVAYNASERYAASHLGAYDYLVSEPTIASEEGNIFFNLKRVGVTARFYLKAPTAEVFEELQLVTHNTQLFALQGTMDLSSMTVSGDNQTISITPTKQSNVITLSYDYNASDATNHPGLDMTDTSSEYYHNNVGYIVSYLMLPPVDLSTAVPTGSTNTVNLYLVSHTKADPTVKKFYKSANLATPNLTSNLFYQWTSANNANDPEPIKFQEVTVQQWEDDTAVNNGTNGTGTEGW